MIGQRRTLDLEMPRTGKPFGRGVVWSFVFHGVVIATVVWAGSRVSGEVFRPAGGAGAAGGGGGGGGSRVSLIELVPVALPSQPARVPSPEPRVSAELPIPKPVLKPVTDIQTRLAIRPAGTVVVAERIGRGVGTGEGPGSGTGTGGGIGSGTGTGIGSGTGPGTGGEAGEGFPPQPRHVLLPPDAPKSVKGREFEVMFWIDERGVVTKVEVRPPIGDAGYRRKFLERMYQFTFHPARTSAGTPVSAHFVIPITP